MIASLMMYQRPELVGAHQRFWSLIREQLKSVGIASPENLSQDEDEFHVWRHRELVLSQTCGMPYRNWLQKDVNLVGTPDYGLEACAPGYYRSAILVRESDARVTLEAFENSVFAYNQTFSQSGYAVAYWHCKPQGFWFQNTLPTGQHLESARAVADGRADIASLDAVTWRLIKRYEPFADKLRVLEWSTPTPGLPLITSKSLDANRIYDAVGIAVLKLSARDRDDLGIVGIVKIPKTDYLAVANPDLPANT